MKVVVDTYVFISGVFFGGKPQRVLGKIVDGEIFGLCSAEILDEYREIVQRMMERKKGSERLFNLYSDETQILPQVVEKLSMVPWGHHCLVIQKDKRGIRGIAQASAQTQRIAIIFLKAFFAEKGAFAPERLRITLL